MRSYFPNTRRHAIHLGMTVFALSWMLSSTFAADAITSPAVIHAGDFKTLQQAADAIPAGGGVLRIPPGNYEITEPIRIKTGDTRIKGDGSATHIKNTNADGRPAILIEHPDFAEKPAPRDKRLWRVAIANLRISGNPKSGAGIEARFIEEIMLDDVSSSYNGGDGILLSSCYEDPRISNCLLTYNAGSGLNINGCHDIIVSATQFEENQDGLRCIDSFNLTMTGNNLDDHLGNGVVIENTYGSVVSGNMIEECEGWAIVLDRDCYGITLSSNVIAHDFAGGIDLRDAHGCAISANTFTIVKQAAIAVRKESGSITISANNFGDSWIGTDDDDSAIQKRDETASDRESNPNEAAGILLTGCDAVVISGNLFSRLSSEPIVQKGDCKRIFSSGNGAVQR